MRPTAVSLVLSFCVVSGSAASAQTSSIGQRSDRGVGTPVVPAVGSAREGPAYQGNPLLEAYSLIAVPVKPPKKFKRHDIITIIVRQQKKFEADGDLESKKKFEVESTLDAFLKFIDDGIGASAFRRGKPNVDYEFESRVKNEGDTTREDTFTTRISGHIVDVKPNGNLVIEARSRIKHDEEEAIVTVTGVVRSTDLTPDNTVLSTKVANLTIDVKNTGAVRDASTRGWLTRALDFLKPI